MAVHRDGLFINCHETKMRSDRDAGFPRLPEEYGLARMWPAALALDESSVTNPQQDSQEMWRIAARTLAAQEAVSTVYCAAILQADASLAAVRQIMESHLVKREIPALEEFHRRQCAQFLAQLSQITERGVALILAQIQ